MLTDVDLNPGGGYVDSGQWRIQDFQAGGGGGANPKGGDTDPLLYKRFGENCMKMKEIGPRSGDTFLTALSDPPLQILDKFYL